MRYLILFLFPLSILFTSCGEEPKADLSSIENIQKALQKDPADTSALAARSTYYIQRGVADSALTDMLALIKIDSTRSGYYVSLADIYLMKNLTRYTREALEKAIQLNPNNSNAHMKLAELYLYVKMFQPSLNEINEVLKIEKRNPKAYYLKGMVYKESGDTLLAASSFLTATEQDPQYALGYEQLGLIYAAKHDKRAIDFFKNALKVNPNNSLVKYNIGYFYQTHGELENALLTYDDLLKSDPSFANAHYNKGFILFEYMDKPKEALPYFLEAAHQNPRYAEAVYMVGLCNEKLGNKEEAILEYKAALKINPQLQLAQEGLKRMGS